MDERKRQTYRNGERYFSRIGLSYGILTEFLRINVIFTHFFKRNTEIRIRNAGNAAIVKSWRWRHCVKLKTL